MNIYDELGVKRYINATATITIMGGSIMPPEVLDAMKEASQSFVPIPELQQKVGERIAKLTHNEAAYVTNGAAAGMVLATAACLTRNAPERRMDLPYTDGMANEIVTYGPGRVGYDFAIRQAGGKLVNYGDENGATVEQLEAAITDKTAAIFIFQFAHRMEKQLPMEKVVEIGKKHNIPVLVDAAAQIPMKENLWKFTRDIGVDAAIFSGGKGIRGPQSSGLVLGKKWIVDLIAGFACPNAGIGRPMKVGKEEIVGLMTAVKLYMESDEDVILKDYEQQVQAVINGFAGAEGVIVTRDFPSEAGQPMPRAKLYLGDGALMDKGLEVAEYLKQGEIGVHVAADKNAIYINPQTLMQGEIYIVIDRLKQAFDAVK